MLYFTQCPYSLKTLYIDLPINYQFLGIYFVKIKIQDERPINAKIPSSLINF